MTKKNDKRLCWNCDGSVSLHLANCPYCGVDLSLTPEKHGDNSNPFQGFASPFQNADPLDKSVPTPPYGHAFNQDIAVSEDEWNQSLGEEADSPKNEEELSTSTKREMVALLLLLPGVVFFLFGLALMLFSSDGILTLEWNQSLAMFYFLGAIPLLFLGWRALR